MEGGRLRGLEGEEAVLAGPEGRRPTAAAAAAAALEALVEM